MEPETITTAPPVDTNPVATEVATEVATSVSTPVATSPVSETTASVVKETDIPFDVENYNWDNWNGSEADFPDTVKPYIAKASSFWKKQLESQERDEANILALTKLLSYEEEKPEAQIDDTKIADYEKLISDLKDQLEEREVRIKDYDEKTRKKEEEEESAWVNKIQVDNPDVFKNERRVEIVRELIDTEQDFEIEDAIILARQNKSVIEKAKEYKKRGATSNLAVEFAIKELSAPPKPGSADLVEGASRIVRGNSPDNPSVSNTDPKKARDNAVEFALRRHAK